jgi:hypothetical protein
MCLPLCCQGADQGVSKMFLNSTFMTKNFPKTISHGFDQEFGIHIIGDYKATTHILCTFQKTLSSPHMLKTLLKQD